jgi:membrane protein DedA with SNARE-associated domain
MTDDAPTIRATPPKRRLILVLIPILAVVIAGYVAGASWANLQKSHPAVLIALSPINRYLLLTSIRLNAPTYFTVGFIRHILPDPFFWLLGYWWGDRALAWAIETYPIIRKVLGEDGKALEAEGSRKILYPLALIAPNNWVSLVCGAARIPFRRFAVLNAVGTIGRLALMWWLGKVFRSQLNSIANFVARYQWPATAISVVLVLATIAWQFRKGTGELVGLTRLSDELEPDD